MMRARHARFARGGRLAALLIAFGVALVAGSAFASDLFFPRETAETLKAEIDRQCPECRAKGLSPCGNPDIQPGKRVAKALFQGTPRRGYLLTFMMPHRAFFDALVTPDRDAFLADMRRRFSEIRLIVLDDRFEAVRVLPAPNNVVVDYTPEHHKCFGIEKRSSSCCLGDGGDDRSCLPKADSPRVHMSFADAAAGETLDVVYAPIPGFSKLVRRGEDRSTLYFCLTDDAGVIKAR